MSKEIGFLRERKVAEIDQIVDRNNPMVIASNYKGIILTQPVMLLSIVPGRVIFHTPEPIVSLTLKERVHLYSLAYREIVSARVLKCNAIIGNLELTDLTLTGRCWNERQTDRVQPRDPVYVYVEHNKALVRATMDNLSVGGMSLMACSYREKALHTDFNKPVRLTFQLPGDNVQLDIKGKVVHTRQAGRLVINGVKLMASSPQEKRIDRYVKARKSEILAELERIFRETREQYWMPDLYH